MPSKLYYNEEQVWEMAANIHDCWIPAELIPKCPVYDRDMDYNLHVVRVQGFSQIS